MTRRDRLVVVYKGGTLLATGRVSKVADELGVTVEKIAYMATPLNHKLDRGYRKVAFYIDELGLPEIQHRTFMMLYEWQMETKRTINALVLTRLLIEKGMAHSSARRTLYILGQKGFLTRLPGTDARYVPNEKSHYYYEECKDSKEVKA